MSQTKTTAELLEELTLCIKDAIFVSNSMLPERYHDNKSGGRTLDGIEKIYNREVKARVERAELQAETNRRIAAYRNQVEQQVDEFKHGNEIVEIEYDVDDYKLYRNQLAFVGGMVNSGMIEADDLIED